MDTWPVAATGLPTGREDCAQDRKCVYQQLNAATGRPEIIFRIYIPRLFVLLVILSVNILKYYHVHSLPGLDDQGEEKTTHLQTERGVIVRWPDQQKRGTLPV